MRALMADILDGRYGYKKSLNKHIYSKHLYLPHRALLMAIKPLSWMFRKWSCKEIIINQEKAAAFSHANASMA
jgi:hypothetical protein